MQANYKPMTPQIQNELFESTCIAKQKPLASQIRNELVKSTWKSEAIANEWPTKNQETYWTAASPIKFKVKFKKI